jgi:mannose-6-phosphate isomerase-like protein (cupin superfamily)
MNAMMLDREPRPLVTVTDPQGRFRQDYNRDNFMFKHELSGHPLFELGSLVELTRRMPDHGEHYWSNGPVAVNNTWSDGTTGRQSLQDTITNIEHNNSIVILKHTEQDEVFAPVLQNVLATMIDLSGAPMRDDVIVGEVLILVSSPGRITPYHMDAETNFLLQITGDKWFHIFSHTDRTLVTEQEREDFFAVSRNCAVYREDRQNECNKYDLHAGYGVHVPPCSPHWVRNRDNISVALSVNYELRSMDRLEKLYKFNHRLRRLGLNPAPPAMSGWRDRMKLAASNGVAALKSLGRGRPAPPPWAVWTPS